MRAIILAAALALTPIAAEAMPVACGKTGYMIGELRGKHREAPLLWRESREGVVLQLWGGRSGYIDGQSWTVVAHRANGISCVLASGKDLPLWAFDLPGGWI